MSQKPLSTVILVLLLWLAGLGAAAQFAKFALPFSFVQAQYPDAGAEIGWLLTLISALGALLGMTAGVLVARVGLGKIVVIALIIGGGASLWQTTLPNLSIMLASRFIEGISHLMIVVAAPTLIAQIASDRYRGLSMTLWSSFFGVSFAAMAWFGLPFVAARGLSDLLIGHSVFMGLIAVILAVALNVTGNLRPTATMTPLSVTSVVKQHIAAYRSPYVAAPAFGWLFYTLTFVSLLTVLPDLLPVLGRGTIVGFMPLMSIAVTLVIVPALLTKFSAISISVAGFVLSAVVVFLFFVGLPLAYICLGLFAALGLIQGASFAAVPELNTTDETRALANGADGQCREPNRHANLTHDFRARRACGDAVGRRGIVPIGCPNACIVSVYPRVMTKSDVSRI
jgi:DHA1 family inner membrane transport protein